MSAFSLDLAVLRMMAERKNYDRLINAIPAGTVNKETQAILKRFGEFFHATDASRITFGEFFPFLRAHYPKWREEDAAHWSALVRPIDKDNPAGLNDTLVGKLLASDLGNRALAVIETFSQGGDVELGEALKSLTEDYESALQRKVKTPRVAVDMAALIESEQDTAGLRWRLDCLNSSTRPLRSGDFGIIAARPDRGKCECPLTPVLLADGRTIPLGDVRVGDVLAGPFMNNMVTSTTRGRGQMFRITYPWGDSYDVNDVHVLSLKRSKAEGQHRHGDVLNVPLDEYLRWPESRRQRYKGWKAGLSLPEVTLPIPPYLLGAWLGDGHSGSPGITSMDAEIVQEFSARYGQPTRVVPAGRASSYFWGHSKLTPELQACGVYKNKHVPDLFLRAGDAQRAELLAGLLDTDGHNHGCGFEFSSKLDSLKDAVLYLARSLGIHATASRTFKRATNCQHAGDWYWRVRLGVEAYTLPLRLPRHRLGSTRKPKRGGLQFGFTVTPLGEGDYAGITLTGDSLYMHGDFTVTHNTSFVASEVTFLAPQLYAMYEGTRPIVWLNNEGPGERIQNRVVQAALGVTVTDMLSMGEAELMRRYREAVGHEDMIQVYNIHGFQTYEVLDLIRKTQAGIVVFDMIDNIRFAGQTLHGGERTDQLLESMYQWARESGVIHDFIGLATSQISDAGEGEKWPAQNLLKDSRTGKQGACDFIITVGSHPNYERTRFIGMSKNKIVRQGGAYSPRCEVVFNRDTCRFEMPLEAAPGAEDAAFKGEDDAAATAFG